MDFVVGGTPLPRASTQRTPTSDWDSYTAAPKTPPTPPLGT